jgi:DNA-directed RNA polymerase subunit beta'
MNTQKGRLFQKLQIGVASPKQIRQWAERFLPNGETVGEVTSWETVNYKTLKPETNGLFCQKIFGPIVDFTCACGKKSAKVQRGFCPKCGVERTHSRVRRYRLGYIKLKQPVVHPLYASHRPSPLGLCMNWPTKRIQSVTKTAEFCCFSPIFTIFRSHIESGPFFQKDFSRNSLLATNLLDSKNTVIQAESISKQFFANFSKKKFDRQVDLNTNTSDSKHIFFEKGLELSDKRKGVGLTSIFQNVQKYEFFFSQDKLNNNKTNTPRLFSRAKKSTRVNLNFNLGNGEARLYGIAYDATWRQVEEFQEFLFYLWEQSFYYESCIPYYVFTKQIENQIQEIPRHEQAYAIQTGGFAFQHILSHLDIGALQQEIATHSLQCKLSMQLIQERIAGLDFRYFEDRKEFKKLRIKLNRLQQLQLKWKRQLETFRDFEKGKMQPAWMILSYLPVLPPGLRPITSIRGELIVSDINSLYRKVLIRNKRINRGANFGIFDTALAGSWLSWCYNVRQVQEAVDELLKTGSVESGKPLKSLLEGLKGKQGRFRQHLLGKRVDYSGRSVIVVGPELKLHQCGLPKQMAVELFQPFIIQKLRKKGIVFTTTAAKALIAERKPIIWSILGEILRTHPILLNRAPTLHRLGIQAFLPQLVEGKAILLHPLVCPAFNADFDGDQMAVHVPLSAKTRAEALELLWSRNHLLAPASGQPLLLPTQDMVLGFYYLTCSQEKNNKNLENLIHSYKALLKNESLLEMKNNLYFSNFSQIKASYDRGILTLHTPIWLRWNGFAQTFITENQSRLKENIVETRINSSGRREALFLDNCQILNQNNDRNSIKKKRFSSSIGFNSETGFSNQLFQENTTSYLSKNENSIVKSQFVRTTTGRVFMHSWIFQHK